MTRTSLLMMACLGFVACGSNSGAGDAGDGGDGGDGGKAGPPTTCTTADDTQGDCSWPEYCSSGKCTLPQGLNAQGMDVMSSAACIYSASTLQGTLGGTGNLDTDRTDEDGGIELLASDSAIITDLSQIAVQGMADCVQWIGPNTTEYQESSKACSGGNTDAAGNAICAMGEAAMLFQGHAYDPQAHFEKKEGPPLDAQFWWMVSEVAPTNFIAPGPFGAAQSGFIIPQTGWTASGGAFVMAQCLDKDSYPLAPSGYPVTLHFADTGTDGGVAGNSYCTDWSE